MMCLSPVYETAEVDIVQREITAAISGKNPVQLQVMQIPSKLRDETGMHRSLGLVNKEIVELYGRYDWISESWRQLNRAEWTRLENVALLLFEAHRNWSKISRNIITELA